MRECQNIQPNVQNADLVIKLKKDKVKDKSFYNVAKSKLTQQLLGKVYIYMVTVSKSIYDRLRSVFWLKLASTDVISNHGLRYFQISVLSKFSDLWPIYWLGLWHNYVSDVIGYRFEKVRNSHRFENYFDLRIFLNDIDLRYRCLWRRKRAWIWGLDVN